MPAPHYSPLATVDGREWRIGVTGQKQSNNLEAHGTRGLEGWDRVAQGCVPGRTGICAPHHQVTVQTPSIVT
jgi:hypothetical protein